MLDGEDARRDPASLLFLKTTTFSIKLSRLERRRSGRNGRTCSARGTILFIEAAFEVTSE